jgi:uncharacterized membrane protein YphA (DoxX/SURF4 family)
MRYAARREAPIAQPDAQTWKEPSSMAVHSHRQFAAQGALIVTETHVNTALFVVGRVLFGGYFLYSSFDHFTQYQMLASAAGAHGVPFPDAAVIGTGVLMLVGSLSILMGAWPQVGAALIAIFLIGVTPVMHAFWADPTPELRMMDIVNFTKNVALIGGCAFIASIPRPWRGSVHG